MSGSRDLFKPLDVGKRKKKLIKSLVVKGSRESCKGMCEIRRSKSLEQQRWYWHSTSHCSMGWETPLLWQ